MARFSGFVGRLTASQMIGNANPKYKLIDLLLKKDLALNEQEARSLILSGKVYTDHRLLDKEKELLKFDTAIFIKHKPHQYVSRAAIKLAHALSYFALKVNDLIALDIGCGAGGFSQILLAQNVAKLYAVDVGYGEFNWALRQNKKLILLERTNAKYLDNTMIPDQLDLIVCDASFIGLAQILPSSMLLLKKTGKIIALIKPQFEVDKSITIEKGIVEDPMLHQLIVEKITNWFKENNYKVHGVCESPIRGAKGNIEFLIMAEKI
jgi:23S rRNA (cytidine1920-2'-O)/16S rRNA (cytidine1409-2'-O)-methyltransferase